MAEEKKKRFSKSPKSRFSPGRNRNVCVYGPPSMLRGGGFKPEDDEPEDVYGPPSFWGGEDDEPKDFADDAKEDKAEQDDPDKKPEEQ